jgi:hypothetical protein
MSGFHDDRDDEDRDDALPFEFDSLREFFEQLRRASREGRFDDGAFDATFRFDVGSLDPGAGGPDGSDRDREGPGRRGMGPGAPGRGGHPSFGGAAGSPFGSGEANANANTDAAAGPTPTADGTDPDPDVEVREGDGTTEVLADLGRLELTAADVEASVIDGALVVVGDAGTLFEAPLPADGALREVTVNNGVLVATVTHAHE